MYLPRYPHFARFGLTLGLLILSALLGLLLGATVAAGPTPQSLGAYHATGRVSEPVVLHDPLPPGEPVHPSLKADDWTVLLDENFDGVWPNGSWSTRDDNGATSGEYYWSNRCANGVNHLNWAIGGGANGSSLPCDGPYAANTNSWAFYGPLDLTNATAGLLYYDY